MTDLWEPEEDGQQIPVIAASALSIPPVRCREDLPLAVRYGHQVPDARWYVEKRARALGASEYLPGSWGVP